MNFSEKCQHNVKHWNTFVYMCFSPYQTIVSKYGTQFRGNSQHDALEFLLWLLDRVHEDVNLVPHNNNNTTKAPGKVRRDNCVSDEGQLSHSPIRNMSNMGSNRMLNWWITNTWLILIKCINTLCIKNAFGLVYVIVSRDYMTNHPFMNFKHTIDDLL